MAFKDKYDVLRRKFIMFSCSIKFFPYLSDVDDSDFWHMYREYINLLAEVACFSCLALPGCCLAKSPGG